MKLWFKTSCFTSKSVLYEDEIIQVAYEHTSYNASKGRGVLYVGNKQPIALNGFSMKFPQPSQELLVLLNNAEIPDRIMGNQQCRVSVACKCMQPFLRAGKLELAFRLEGKDNYCISLHLPILMSKFIEGVSFTGQQWQNNWSNASCVSNEAKHVFSNAFANNSTTLEALKAKISLLNVTICDDLCIAQGTKRRICASGTLRTDTTGANGRPISVGTLLVIEANDGQFQIAVRSMHKSCSENLLKIMEHILF